MIRAADWHDPGVESCTGWWSRCAQVARSLQCKATVLVVALTLSVTAVVSGYFLRVSAKLARAEHAERIKHLSAVLAEASASAIANGEHDRLEILAREFTNNGPMEYITFADREGHELTSAERRAGVLARHLRDQGDQPRIPGTPVAHVGPDGGSPCLDIVYPINLRRLGGSSTSESGALLLGYVHTGMLADGWHQSMSSTLDLVVGVGILAIVVAVPSGFLLIRRIVSPLEVVAGAMLRFSKGELDVRSPLSRRDEIGDLALAFNRMADQHQQTHERIVRLNADLEKRVAERTRQLRELAAREPLTGLYNRRYFGEVLERSFAEATRYDNDLSCLMLDLDDFKMVNDMHGHQVGDELLVFMAGVITSQLRAADVAARFGGDEFILLLPQTAIDRAYVLGERIVEKFAREAPQSFPELRVGVSVGVAGLRSDGVNDTES
ncbi:MAG: diguanylate cyclase, partial [Phycisphaerae bacterium]